jgi:hypothetical protein
MEDPVWVFGRTDDTITCIHIPDTDWYIHDTIRDDERLTRMWPFMESYQWFENTWKTKGLVMSSMVIERGHLIDIFNRCMDNYKRPSYITADLDAWKTQLVFERLRRNVAARIVQRQFRECMSNPGYALCRRRLLREFAEGISV